MKSNDVEAIVTGISEQSIIVAVKEIIKNEVDTMCNEHPEIVGANEITAEKSKITTDSGKLEIFSEKENEDKENCCLVDEGTSKTSATTDNTELMETECSSDDGVAPQQDIVRTEDKASVNPKDEKNASLQSKVEVDAAAENRKEEDAVLKMETCYASKIGKTMMAVVFFFIRQKPK